jgi:vancomycin resistance protein YoaR
VFFLLTVFFIYNYWNWKNNYSDKIYPGIKIGELDLGGKSIIEAKNLIDNQIKKIRNSGLQFRYNAKIITIPIETNSFDADLSYSLLTFDQQKTILLAYGDGPSRTFGYYLLTYFKLISPKTINVAYLLDEEKIKTLINNNFPELNIEPVNAYFSVSGNNSLEFKLQSNREQPGKEIDYRLVLSNLNNNLNNLKNDQIIIKTSSKYPTVRQIDLLGLDSKIKEIINRGDLTLQLNPATSTIKNIEETATSTQLWEISSYKIAAWISAQNINNQPSISLDQDKIKQYLKTYVSPAIDQEPVRSRFKIVNGRISSWQKGKDGQQLDLEATAAQMTKNILNGQTSSDLIIKIIPVENLITDDYSNIKELIGTGKSVFTGSPANRIHNINVGAAALHGLLIKPGEEFSLIKALGEIDAKSGYLQELVIKGDKTVPEYGGGLCQIGTTIFRTALASGLPITMRQNHSYRVSYYEPAGTDATIYDPKPDLRFINDTGNYILIQTRIIKNNLYFDFWGTSDGRTVTTTTPVIYNIVKPEPAKIIETDSLKAGEKKCTESSHNGADAYFDYTVVYPKNSTTTPIQKRRFSSHYIPWQAVCLVGKTNDTTATSTVSTASSTINATTTNQKALETSNASSTTNP